MPPQRLAAQAACRGQFALERGVRPHTTVALCHSCSYVAWTLGNASVICTKVVGVFFAPSLKDAPDW